MADVVKEPTVHGLKPSAILVQDQPKFDLDSYISNYDGSTRVDRLVTIGLSSHYLAQDALKLALAEAKHGKDVNRYLDIAVTLQTIDSSATVDTAWAETRQKQVDKEVDRLEQELKGYKNNLIKESIRMGNEELGGFYYEIGNYQAAQRAFTRQREYCTTSKHIAEMNLKLILVAIAQENWMAVSSSINRIANQSLSEADKARVEPLYAPILALSWLQNGDYHQAAQTFIHTPAEFIQGLEPFAGVLANRQILSPNDVAIYGALCALATFSRAELASAVLGSSTFRQFLELEPHLRRAVSAFVGAKYTTALSILDSYKTDYLLDIYLQRHVSTLWTLIRRKSIVAYFAPFSRVEIKAMAQAFGVSSTEDMTKELTEMVEAGLLRARVDVVEGLLIARRQEDGERRAVHERALKIAGNQERAMQLRLWHINMKAAGLEVKGEKLKGQDGEGGMAQMARGWGKR